MSAGEADALIHKVRKQNINSVYNHHTINHILIVIIIVNIQIVTITITRTYTRTNENECKKADKDGNKEIDMSEFGELWAAIRCKIKSTDSKSKDHFQISYGKFSNGKQGQKRQV